MNKSLWRGMAASMMFLLTLGGCAGGPAALSPIGVQPSEESPGKTPSPKATIAFNFPTETSQPTPTALPDGPFTWSGGERPLLMAHYMPWYQTPEGHGSWGWHWTMDHFSPRQGPDGAWTELASHYTPLTGPYDSSDPLVLEYQALLMKLSGIDGVIIDWYGIEDFWDYGTINASTARVIEAMEKAGLKVAICYEDQTVKHMLANQHLKVEETVAHGQAVMRYLQETWFDSQAYLKVGGRPVLFTFGPQYFAGSQWGQLFSVLDPQPLFVTLDGKDGGAIAGGYPWPPMWAASGGTLSIERLAAYLDEFYTRYKQWDYRVGGVFPGFHDIYQEAGAGQGYGLLDARDGQTFRFTLQRALDAQPHLVQLITWNDYGEGTIIEPTVEFEYRYLEMVQEARKATAGGDFTFTADDLRLPLRLYQLRVKYAGDIDQQAKLDQAAEAILAGEAGKAENILKP